MKTIIVMREDEFDPDKHITFPELYHIIKRGESPPKDKALVLAVSFKKRLLLSQDDLILKNTSPQKRITP